MRVMLTICALLMPGALLADIVFEPPRGCTKVLTVQQRSCQVVNHWQCGSNSELRNWYGTFSEDGVIETFETYGPDHETLSIQSFAEGAGLVMTKTEVTDGDSLSAALSNGVDTFDFVMSTSIFVATIDFRMVGTTEFSGKKEIIDGETFLLLESTGTMTTLGDGAFGDHINADFTGTFYVTEDGDSHFEGVSDMRSEQLDSEYRDHTPVEVIRPGEDGFFSRIPKYDCGAQVSSLIKTTPRAFDDEDRL